MKRLLLIIISISLCTSIFAQVLTVDAGVDKYVCMTAEGVIVSPQIGGNPTINGGTPPYTVKWEANYNLGSLVFSASYFLNDTTITNPTLVEVPITYAPVTFYLTITDSMNNIAHDSTIIYASEYNVLSIPNGIEIIAGDSSEISILFQGGIPPLTYYWSPNYNISNTSSAMPTVWPDSTTNYSCLIVDSIGCPLNQSLNVLVHPVNTNTILQENLKIYPNPTQDWLIIELKESEIKNIKITDMSGKIVLQEYDLINNQLNISHLTSGIYVLTIEDKAGNLGQFKIMKQ